MCDRKDLSESHASDGAEPMCAECLLLSYALYGQAWHMAAERGVNAETAPEAVRRLVKTGWVRSDPELVELMEKDTQERAYPWPRYREENTNVAD